MNFGVFRYNKTLRVVGFSAVVGFACAVVVHFFNLAAEHAFELAELVYGYVRENLIFLLVLVPSVGALAVLAGLVSKGCAASRGGGVPFSEGIVRGQLKFRWLLSMVCMMAGTILAMLIGLPLGCEGPSIFVGCAIGYGFSQIFRHTGHEQRLLATAGACSGLAVAFNTPLAGIIFSVEEAHRKFSPTILLPAMVAVVVAVASKKLLFGDVLYLAAYSDMDVSPSLAHIFGAVLVGAICGAFGCFFNFVMTRKSTHLDKIPLTWRVLIPAAIALFCAIVLPLSMGAGHRVFVSVAEVSVLLIALTLVAKFVMITTASRSGASGGIFIPMMSIGALTGALISKTLSMIGLENSIMLLTLMGACTFFSAAVRAPLTAVVLSAEITGFRLEGLFLITAAVMVSYAVAELIKTEPLYEHMLENLIEKEHKPMPLIESRFTVLEGCYAQNKHLRTLILPYNCIITGITREQTTVFPDGDTTLKAGDSFTAKHESTKETKQEIKNLFEKKWGKNTNGEKSE